MGNNKKRILLIGPIPPPIGGVSIHILRLSFLLEHDFKIDFIDESHIVKKEYFNIRNGNLILYFKKIIKTDLLYIHSGKRFLRLFHLIVGKLFLKQVILTIHSYRSKNNLLYRALDEFFFRLATKIVIVNSYIFESISLPTVKSVVIQPFIPPSMENEATLPNEITAWIQNRKAIGDIIVCSNAWQLATYMNEDLYGLDICIKVADNFHKQKVPVSFIFNVSSTEKYKEKYLHFESIIKKSDFKENFLLLNMNISFVKLIENSDIVLRPTNTDGDSLTVREALFLGKPIIASDIVRRPEGTILFKNRDISDLENKIKECLRIKDFPSLDQENCIEINEYQRTYVEMIIKILN